MTQPDDLAAPGDGSTLEDAAAEQLRDRTHHRALAIAPDVLRHVLTQPRRSLPVRVRVPETYLHVSEQVIRTVITGRVQSNLGGVAVGRVVVRTTVDERVETITVELIGQYGRDLGADADAARAEVAGVLADLLGPHDATVEVTHTHLHFSDITTTDPLLVDPADE